MQALDTFRGETDTKGNNKKTEEQTWICTVQSLLFQSHDCRHAISTLQHIHLRLTHFQCSQYHELQSMLQIPSRLPREYESPSPDHHTRDTVVVTLFSDTATCCTFINVFVTESVIPWYAHPDSQYQFIQLFTRSHFTHMCSLYSHGFSGVVFTPPVGYSRLTSAVNDPTVTKQMNSVKSCLEEVSQLLVYQVALINQYWVRLHGDFRRHKEKFVPIIGFVELLLLFLSTAAK